MITPSPPIHVGEAHPLAELLAPEPQVPVGLPSRASATPVAVRKLSVVVPAFNEADNLGRFLDELLPVLARLSHCVHEVIVVDDGSTDGTDEIARSRNVRVVRHPENQGNGAAIKRGIRASRGDWILLIDGDGQHPPADIARLWERAGEYDMVVGSRGGGQGVWYRNLANRTYNALASYVTSRPIPDLTSGFRLVRAAPLKSFVSLLPNTFSYPTTITLSMLRQGYNVRYVPIQVRTRGGRSKIRLLRDGSRFFLIILRIATMFAPLRVFLPVSTAVFALGLLWYVYTFVTEHRFTNMGALLLTHASVLFALGLISEQIAQLRFDRSEGPGDRPQP